MPDANNIDGGACGMSIYANALPELRGLDVAWSAMVDEIQDSRSIALVDDRLLREPGRKNVSVRLPRYVQNVAGSAAESFYQEIDRKLKTGERQTGINMLLNDLFITERRIAKREAIVVFQQAGQQSLPDTRGRRT